MEGFDMGHIGVGLAVGIGLHVIASKLMGRLFSNSEIIDGYPRMVRQPTTLLSPKLLFC